MIRRPAAGSRRADPRRQAGEPADTPLKADAREAPLPRKRACAASRAAPPRVGRADTPCRLRRRLRCRSKRSVARGAPPAAPAVILLPWGASPGCGCGEEEGEQLRPAPLRSKRAPSAAEAPHPSGAPRRPSAESPIFTREGAERPASIVKASFFIVPTLKNRDRSQARRLRLNPQ